MNVPYRYCLVRARCKLITSKHIGILTGEQRHIFFDETERKRENHLWARRNISHHSMTYFFLYRYFPNVFLPIEFTKCTFLRYRSRKSCSRYIWFLQLRLQSTKIIVNYITNLTAIITLCSSWLGIIQDLLCASNNVLYA